MQIMTLMVRLSLPFLNGPNPASFQFSMSELNKFDKSINTGSGRGTVDRAVAFIPEDQGSNPVIGKFYAKIYFLFA